ncbi:hypothetical protein [Plantactinospora veratri]
MPSCARPAAGHACELEPAAQGRDDPQRMLRVDDRGTRRWQVNVL